MTQGLPADFHDLPYSQQKREMLAFYQRVGYDPVEQAKESRMRALEEANRKLRSEVEELAEKLRVLEQDYQSELHTIRLNLADYAQLAVAQALRNQQRR